MVGGYEGGGICSNGAVWGQLKMGEMMHWGNNRIDRNEGDWRRCAVKCCEIKVLVAICVYGIRFALLVYRRHEWMKRDKSPGCEES